MGPTRRNVHSRRGRVGLSSAALAISLRVCDAHHGIDGDAVRRRSRAPLSSLFLRSHVTGTRTLIMAGADVTQNVFALCKPSQMTSLPLCSPSVRGAPFGSGGQAEPRAAAPLRLNGSRWH